MPTINEWETVKQQCSAFNERGFVVKCDVNHAGAAIRIAKGLKVWHFYEPDTNVVIKQLAQLWRFIDVKERKKH